MKLNTLGIAVWITFQRNSISKVYYLSILQQIFTSSSCRSVDRSGCIELDGRKFVKVIVSQGLQVIYLCEHFSM